MIKPTLDRDRFLVHTLNGDIHPWLVAVAFILMM